MQALQLIYDLEIKLSHSALLLGCHALPLHPLRKAMLPAGRILPTNPTNQPIEWDFDVEKPEPDVENRTLPQAI